jgi:hypothetical protein
MKARGYRGSCRAPSPPPEDAGPEETTVASAFAPAERWWRGTAHYAPLAAHLDGVRAIDNHTHLLRPGRFQPEADAAAPLALRSSNPATAAALTACFGVAVEPGAGGLAAAARAATDVRAARVARLGVRGYWHARLDAAGVEIALVNQPLPEGTDGARLRWVPHASTLLYPLPADALRARSPQHEQRIGEAAGRLRGLLAGGGLAAVPPDLDGYAAFVDRTLAGWRDAGAVAVKFWDAYLRTLAFEDVPEAQARALYARGLAAPLPRADYLALQDYLARRVFREAGRLGLPVHFHSSYGGSYALRLRECDVRNLEGVLTDGRLFGTRFVLLHGGAPLLEEAAYLALKPHVWLDVSALPFVYPVPELAQALRTYLLYAPEKVLFGTDAVHYPGVPVGAEVQHLALCRTLREALSAALAGLVRDGLVDAHEAVRLGEGVLHANARRLYGWALPA